MLVVGCFGCGFAALRNTQCSLPINRNLRCDLSLSPREARAGREPERGGSQGRIPPLPNPLLPPASGREGETVGPPVVHRAKARTKSLEISPRGMVRVKGTKTAARCRTTVFAWHPTIACGP